LFAALWALWLVMNDTLAPAHVLLGALVAWLVPLLVQPLKPPGPRLKRPLVLARLILRVGGDVVLSALVVAGGVLRARSRPPRGTFVAVPLELRDPHGLAALAMITAVVPGTIWSELHADASTVLIHVFDVEDEAAFVASFKARYEQPLREIFE
jgi:multicomponent K+:H+ antiporter subunit E